MSIILLAQISIAPLTALGLCQFTPGVLADLNVCSNSYRFLVLKYATFGPFVFYLSMQEKTKL